MWFCATYLRLQASFIVGFSLWIAAFADNRVLLEPEYSLHQRPPTDEGEPLLIQVTCRKFLYILFIFVYFVFFRRASTCGISWKWGRRSSWLALKPPSGFIGRWNGSSLQSISSKEMKKDWKKPQNNPLAWLDSHKKLSSSKKNYLKSTLALSTNIL